jgi:hypothetical protein
MKKLNLFLILIMLGFGMAVVHTAHAEITSSPLETCGANCGTGPEWNARIAIAPYAQVVADDSYTFIGISHPSLATAHTSIGVVVEAMNMTTVPNTSAGRAAVFTVSAGETHRVFVINQSHATINLNNSSFTDTQTHLITTSDSSQFGNIRVIGIGSHPTVVTSTAKRPGAYKSGSLDRFDNISQLSMWGVVYQSANGAGFALEFVGDMHDSSVSGSVTVLEAQGTTALGTNSSGSGRGIN